MTLLEEGLASSDVGRMPSMLLRAYSNVLSHIQYDILKIRKF